jgi:hypothetical protein
MDAERFDDMLRLLAGAATRRGTLAFGLSGALTALGLTGSEAKKKKKRKKKKCKGCSECQVCKKGKCQAKPEGSACVGGLCAAGTCSCFNGFIACQGRCIPEDQCCGSPDCGEGGSCQNGTCVCLNGFKRCDNRCIPADVCCDDDDCSGGQKCLSSGSCALPCSAPNFSCPGICDCTATLDDVQVCFSYGNPPANPCPEPECQANSDCAAGEQCLQFFCDLDVLSGRCVELCQV